MKMRAPAVPLITVDPYFSVWSVETDLNFAKTVHWTGRSNSIVGTVTVDGTTYSFLGYHRDLHKMKQISLEIDALSTTAVFETDEITLTAVFTTPVLPDDYRLLTRPVSYMALTYASRDGKEHTVSVNVSACEEIASVPHATSFTSCPSRICSRRTAASEKTGVSGLLRYLGPSPSSRRPEKAITFPRTSMTGNISRLRKAS